MTGMKKQEPKQQPRPPSAQWVREVRAAAKLSQAALSKRIGVHWITVSNWERGKYAPDWESSEKLRKLVPGTPPAPGVLPPGIAERLDPRPRTLEAAEVAAIMDGISPELRSYVRDAVYRILAAQPRPEIPPTTVPPKPDGGNAPHTAPAGKRH